MGRHAKIEDRLWLVPKTPDGRWALPGGTITGSEALAERINKILLSSYRSNRKVVDRFRIEVTRYHEQKAEMGDD